MNEQTLKEAKRIYDEEREYLRDWDKEIAENYRRIRNKHEERRLMRELEGEF
jgi:hypothetical protein